jgi:uncharacterized protein (TIGR03437 family)
MKEPPRVATRSFLLRLHCLVAASFFLVLCAHSQTQLASRLFGGSGSDQPAAIATDPQGNIYVAGATTSPDLPASRGFQPKPAVLPFSISSDGGATFTSSALPGTSQITALAAAADGATIYAATPGGVLRSADGGQSWTATSPGIPVAAQVLAVSPADPNIIYAGATTGFYRSTDGGNHWSLIPSQMSQYGTAIFYQILVDPLQPSTLWVVAANTPQPSGIFTSTDGGDTWTARPLPPLPFSPYSIATSLAIDPKHEGTIYAAGQGIPLFKSTDSGQNWAVQASVFGNVTIDPTDSATLYVVTGFEIDKSIDGGVTFSKTGLQISGVRSMAIDPANPSRLYAAQDQALYTSADAGATWTPTRIHAITQMIATPGRLYVGAQILPQVYLAKFSQDLSQLLWTTYLGGNGYHSVSGLAVDASGNAYVTGLTAATDFPITSGAMQTSGRAFVSKISADGTQLLASTYFGGAATFPRAIAVDRAGAVYLAGSHHGDGLPLTPKAFQSAAPGPCKRPADPGGFQPVSDPGFLARLSTDLSSVGYATYLSGSCGSILFGLQVSDSGVVTGVGGTYSLDFPVTSGAMVATAPGTDESGFLAQISADGGSLLYSTYLGGGFTTEAHAVLTDSAGNWYVVGGGSPTPTPGAAHVTANGFCSLGFGIGPPVPRPPTQGEDAFVTVFNAHSAAPIFTATVGGSCPDEADSIAFDSGGNIWISGATQSLDMPTRALVGGLGEQTGGFLAAFSPTGDALLTSGWTGQPSRLVSVAGRITGTAPAFHHSLLGNQYTLATALATFDAVTAPAVEIDAARSYTGATNGGPGIAPGQLIRIAGLHFGPAQTVAGTVADGFVANAIDGLQVIFDGVAAPLLTLQDQSVALAVPFEVRPPSTVIQVLRNGTPVSNPIAWPVYSAVPDVLLVLNGDGTVNSQEHPVKAGSTISVFVTGLGSQTPAVADGHVASAPSEGPVVTVGPGTRINNVPVQPSYIGNAIGLIAGVVQVNVPIPQLNVTGPVLFATQQFNMTVYVLQ